MADLPPPTLPPPAPPPTPEPERRKILGADPRLWIALGVIAIIIVVLAAIGNGTDSDLESDPYWPHWACAEFTRDRLRSPGSADFPEYDDRGVTITRSGARWTVRSFVDSDNALGASVRTNFTCVVRDTGDDWRLEDWDSPDS